jgi:hypothetical protein
MIDIPDEDRVSDFGEVFTPPQSVKEMLGLVPKKSWKDPNQVFFEPSCGDGNFVVEILRRRIDALTPSLGLEKAVETSLETLVAVEIQQDNVDKARVRVEELIRGYTKVTPKIKKLIEESIICKDFFVFMREYEDKKKNEVLSLLFD